MNAVDGVFHAGDKIGFFFIFFSDVSFIFCSLVILLTTDRNIFGYRLDYSRGIGGRVTGKN